MTAGCVVQGIPNICSSTQLRAFYIRPVCTRPSLFCFYPFNRTYTFLTFDRHCFSVRWRPQVDVEEFGFLEKIFSKTKPEERTWAKLVNLKTPYTSTVMGQNQCLQLLSTKQKFVNVSPSFLLYSYVHSLSG